MADGHSVPESISASTPREELGRGWNLMQSRSRESPSLLYILLLVVTCVISAGVQCSMKFLMKDVSRLLAFTLPSSPVSMSRALS